MAVGLVPRIISPADEMHNDILEARKKERKNFVTGIISLSECAKIFKESAKREQNLLSLPEIKEDLEKLSKITGQNIEAMTEIPEEEMEALAQEEVQNFPEHLYTALVFIYRQALEGSGQSRMVRLDDNLLPANVEPWQLAADLAGKGRLDQQGCDELGELFLNSLLLEIEGAIDRDIDAELEIYDTMVIGADDQGYYLTEKN